MTNFEFARDPEKAFGIEGSPVSPRPPEFPVQVIESRERGQFTADFALDFAGAVRRIRKNATENCEVKLLSALLQTLGPDDSLSFIYSGGAGVPLAWRILGRTGAHGTKEAAQRAATDLGRTTVAVLRSSGTPCRFVTACPPAEPGLPTGRSGWVAHVEPASTLIGLEPKGPCGFGRRDAGMLRQLRLPVVTGRPSGGMSIVETVTSGPVSLELVITLHRVTLTSQQKGLLGDALEFMRLQGAMGGHFFTHGGVSAMGPHPELMLGLLEQWLKQPEGFRLECRAIALEPLPEPWLRLLGQEIFAGQVNIRQIEMAQIADREREEARMTADNDFHASQPAGSALPALFPDEEALQSIRTSRCFLLEHLRLSQSGSVVGTLFDGGQAQAVRLPAESRSRHTYVIGATGTGKSTLLYNMIIDDLQAGHGVGLLDPHGDLFDQVLAAIPAERAKDVVLFDATDTERSIGLNFLECVGPHRERQAQFIISELFRCFEKLYDMKQCGGPLFELCFRNSILLMLDDPTRQVTLMEVARLFEDRVWRTALIERCQNPQVAGYWRMAEQLTGDWALVNVGAYITCKLNQFIQNAVLRPIIGQARSTISLRAIMDDRKILLAKLSKGVLGTMDTQFLGLLLLGKLFQAAMSRTDVSVEKRRVFHLYVDEFQTFATDTVVALLAEARK